MKKFCDFFVLTFCGFIFITMLFFTVFFGSNALYMTGLFAKHSVGAASPSDYIKILVECKVRQHELCSDKAAERVIEKFPNNKMALGHLAVRLTRDGEFEKASSFYAAYFSKDGSSAEVNYWYAQLLLEQSQEEEAVRWSYVAVLQDPENEMYSKALHELLMEMDKSVEALALIGFVTKGRPQAHRYWSAEFARLETGAKNLEELMKTDLSVPIRGEEAFVPAVEASNKKLKFFRVKDRICQDCPKSMKISDAKVVSRLQHNFLVLAQ